MWQQIATAHLASSFNLINCCELGCWKDANSTQICISVFVWYACGCLHSAYSLQMPYKASVYMYCTSWKRWHALKPFGKFVAKRHDYAAVWVGWGFAKCVLVWRSAAGNVCKQPQWKKGLQQMKLYQIQPGIHYSYELWVSDWILSRSD